MLRGPVHLGKVHRRGVDEGVPPGAQWVDFTVGRRATAGDLPNEVVEGVDGGQYI
jgi:hypothetical protein